MALVTINQEFGGLGDAEYINQYIVFINKNSIQLCFVYLNVYQLLEVMGFVSHFRANKKCDLILVFYMPVCEKKIYRKTVHTVHF